MIINSSIDTLQKLPAFRIILLTFGLLSLSGSVTTDFVYVNDEEISTNNGRTDDDVVR